MIPLRSRVRPYDWGSVGAISRFLGRDLGGGPEAELWLGAHPGWPTFTLTGATLAEEIALDPRSALGQRGIERFGSRLPFLLKVLAVGKPLSLQVHPTPEQALAGFAAEEARGVPIDAPHRNYKDDQAKPEMMVAVEPVRALCGFRPPAEALRSLRELLAAGGLDGGPVRAPLEQALASPDVEDGLRRALALLLCGDADVGDLVRALVAGARRHRGDDPTASVVSCITTAHPGDPGIAVAVLLNHVELAPGEAIHLGAGTVHAYLAGMGVEVMTTSDNVLRGGMTTKHVDCVELQRIVRFVPEPPRRVPAAPGPAGRWSYRPPVAEFQLQRIEVVAGQVVPVEQCGPTVVLVTAGELELVTEQGRQCFRRGDSVFVRAAQRGLQVRGRGDAVAYAATSAT